MRTASVKGCAKGDRRDEDAEDGELPGPGWGDDRAHCQLLISAFSEPSVSQPVRLVSRTDGRSDGWTDGRMDGWMDWMQDSGTRTCFCDDGLMLGHCIGGEKGTVLGADNEAFGKHHHLRAVCVAVTTNALLWAVVVVVGIVAVPPF
uniref:Uncharacterized protein n=1 Tax=Anopheles merus TaxID=30066 RepID=A0A182VJE9_ANOME